MCWCAQISWLLAKYNYEVSLTQYATVNYKHLKGPFHRFDIYWMLSIHMSLVAVVVLEVVMKNAKCPSTITYTFTHARTHRHTHTCTYARMHARKDTRTNIDTHTHKHRHTHQTRTHTRTHMHHHDIVASRLEKYVIGRCNTSSSETFL